MSALGEVLLDLRGILAAQGLAWYVFGAQALVAHGVVRATQDVDVTVRVDRDALDALVTALSDGGFRHRYPEIAAELARDSAIVPLLHVRTGFDVDLVIAGAGLEALAVDRATIVVLDGVPVPVVSPTDLVVMKILAGRPKDLEDVRGILTHGSVDLAEVRRLLRLFEAALERSDLIGVLDGVLSRSGTRGRSTRR